MDTPRPLRRPLLRLGPPTCWDGTPLLLDYSAWVLTRVTRRRSVALLCTHHNGCLKCVVTFPLTLKRRQEAQKEAILSCLLSDQGSEGPPSVLGRRFHSDLLFLADLKGNKRLRIKIEYTNGVSQTTRSLMATKFTVLTLKLSTNCQQQNKKVTLNGHVHVILFISKTYSK